MHYQGILNDSKGIIDEKDEKEWLRQSFLKVDDLLRLPEG
jgi:hypothetical protein